ncbi:hypothetical protein ATK30_6390 [Amycolatopsis echigonensis]|nr:hypothetical protein ATK30_6390 [Amycolatopsis niigatensis]
MEAESQLKRPGPDKAALLDPLPVLALKLAAAPPELLRKFFDVLRLELRLLYDDPVEIAVTPPAGDVPDAAEGIADQMTDAQGSPAQASARLCAEVVRPPGGSDNVRVRKNGL